ncbi:hypothetical protein [Shewanella gaetbuli]|uniref:Uncharacterized protein n=1 Tax=Shewanella gaetbuli TaxID=220752 RepID=A0A9X1ZPJ1_9GAMM|nr:hypothetical protein [Shewanella gaetbuli]MCL1143745.1 hypothetical protein [Shewanella gaetbuli]
MSKFVWNKFDHDMAKFHGVKRFEREAWMLNWLFNMDVIRHGRAFRDLLIYIKSAACHGRAYTIGLRQAIG